MGYTVSWSWTRKGSVTSSFGKSLVECVCVFCLMLHLLLTLIISSVSRSARIPRRAGGGRIC